MKRSVASRSIGRGLAKIEDLTTDTLIAYAAKAGSTASNGSGTNSPYAVALLNHLTTPGLDVRLALGRVRDEVMKSTGNQQEPYLYGSLGGAEIALVAGKAGLRWCVSMFFSGPWRRAAKRTCCSSMPAETTPWRATLPATWEPGRPRSAQGLKSTEAGVGTLISFSTAPDTVASDGAGRNSPYAGALVKHIASSTDDLNTILINARKDVRQDTKGQQVPWEHSSLEGRFYFNPAAVTAGPVKVGPQQLSEAAEVWGDEGHCQRDRAGGVHRTVQGDVLCRAGASAA
jgi:uncharacterized caspase-like protein